MKKKTNDGWNYRIVRIKEGKSFWYTIRDVYYKNGKAHSWGAEPQAPMGENVAGILLDMLMMTEAVQKPVMEVNKKGNIVETKIYL